MICSFGWHLRMAARDKRFQRQAVACLTKAVARLQPQIVSIVVNLYGDQDDEEFKQLLHALPGPKASVKVARLVNPLN